MALVLNDRVKETTTTTGTSDFALGGAVTGFQTFSAGIGANNTTYYAISSGSDWEVGLGTLSSDGLTLARTTILQSSNSDSIVTFGSGSKDIFCTYPASKAVTTDTAVLSPASATDNAIARYDGTTGKLIQNSGVLVDDDGNIFLGGTTLPIGWVDTYRAIQIGSAGTGQGAVFFGNDSITNKGVLYYYPTTGGTLGLQATDGANNYLEIDSNGISINSLDSGQRVQINGSKFDTNGDLLIGYTTAPSGWTNYGLIGLSGTDGSGISLGANGTQKSVIYVEDTGNLYLYNDVSTGSININTSNAAVLVNPTSVDLYSSGNYCTLDSSGNLILGSSAAATTYGSKIVQIDGTTSALVFKDASTAYGNGYIQYDGAGYMYMGIDTTWQLLDMDATIGRTRLSAENSSVILDSTKASVLYANGNGLYADNTEAKLTASNGNLHLYTFLNANGLLLRTKGSYGTLGQALLSQGSTSGAIWGDVVTPTGTQTFTNKTISADSNTLSGIAASSFVLSNASGNIDGSAAQKAIPSGDVVGTTDAQLLTNKTLTNPVVTGALVEDVHVITDSAGFAIDPTNGSIQLVTLTASRTPTQANWTAGQSVTLMINDGTAYTVTWTSLSVTWVGGSAPTLATSGYTVIELWKVGTTIYGALVGSVA